jgi:hypothetical protein
VHAAPSPRGRHPKPFTISGVDGFNLKTSPQ